MTARSFQYAWGANVGIPLINEVANNIAGHKGVIVNRKTAKQMGIAEGDEVVIEYTGDEEGATVRPAVDQIGRTLRLSGFRP